jgi:hypothetical protein
MGNSSSVKLNDFHDQLISTCLWTTRRNEIIDYHKQQYHQTKYNNSDKYITFYSENVNNVNNIPYLYKRTLSNVCNNLGWEKYNKHNEHLLDNPNKLRSDMIHNYLHHILKDKTEIDQLLMELTLSLKSYSSGDSISDIIDNKYFLDESMSNINTSTNNSYVNLLINNDKNNDNNLKNINNK